MKNIFKRLSLLVFIGIIASVSLTGCASEKNPVNREYSERDLLNLKGDKYSYENGELDKRLGLAYAFTDLEKDLKGQARVNASFISDFGYLFSYTTDQGLDFINKISKNENTSHMPDLSSLFIDYGALYRISSKEDPSNEIRTILDQFKNKEELGKIGDYVYYFAWNEDFDGLDKLSDEDRENLKKILENRENFMKEASIFKGSQEKSHLRDLDAETVDGKKFTSEKFKDYDLTMVNIWSTWCTGCIEEMPDLQDLYERLPKNVNMISICADGDQNKDLALDILKKNKTEFDTLLGNEKLEDSLLKYLDGFPTTVFVDREGNLVGEAIMGMPAAGNETIADIYLKLIDQNLGLVK